MSSQGWATWLHDQVQHDALPASELLRRWTEDEHDTVVLLDLRPEPEYRKSHVRGAVNVPGAIWKQRCDDLEALSSKALEDAGVEEVHESLKPEEVKRTPKQVLLEHFAEKVLVDSHVMELVLEAASKLEEAEHLNVDGSVGTINDFSDVLDIGEYVGSKISSHMRQKVNCARPLAVCIVGYAGVKEEKPIVHAFLSLMREVLKSKTVIINVFGSSIVDGHEPMLDCIAKLPVVATHAPYKSMLREDGFQRIVVEKSKKTLQRTDSDADVTFSREKADASTEVVTIMPGALYVGPGEKYISTMDECSQLAPDEYFKGYLEHLSSSETHWSFCRDIFDLAEEKVQVPIDLRSRSQYTDAKGQRLKVIVKKSYMEKKKTHHGWSKLVSLSKIVHIHSSKVFETYYEKESHLEEDHNVTVATYRFRNKLKFSHHQCKLPIATRLSDEAVLDRFASFFYCMAACMAEGRPVYVRLTPMAIPAVMAYLVNCKMWPLGRAYKYMAAKFPMSQYQEHWKAAGHAMRLLLTYERGILAYQWPSIPLSCIVTHLLGQEDDIRGNVSFFKNKAVNKMEKEFMAAIATGDVQKTKEMLEAEPMLCLSRTSLKGGDLTPLLMAMTLGSPVLSHRSIFEPLARHPAIQLCDIRSHDALYYAIEKGAHIEQLLQYGASKKPVSRRLRLTSLQRAIQFRLPLRLVDLLIDDDTIDHRNGLFQTAAHIAVESQYSDVDKLAVLTKLVEHNADLFLADNNGRTPLDMIVESPKYGEDSQFYLKVHHLVHSRGYARYRYQSFAPPRQNVKVEAFVDGEETFREIAKQLRGAKRVIYISDWWLTPEMYLVRGSVDDGTENGKPIDLESEPWKSNQFINIMKEVTSRDPPVEVFVLVWDNVMEDLQSSQCKAKLEALSPHIQVQTHSSSVLQGWTNHQKIIVVDEVRCFIGGLDICLHRWDTSDHHVAPLPIFVGKDYYHPVHATAGVMGLPLEDYGGLKNRDHPRMGWHDLSFLAHGAIAADVSENFAQRWNFVVSLTGDTHYRLLEPPATDTVEMAAEMDESGAQVQVVRSIGPWSSGFRLKELSVINAIKDAIEKAETYVYIETQFFISVQGDINVLNAESREVESLADVIADRIKRAFLEGKEFRVIFVLPVHPEGNPGDFVTKRIMYHQHRTIAHIRRTLREDFKGHLVTSDDYISYFALANHTIMEGPSRIEHQQIYVHAKLLISDNVTICGSANLNMRSLCGDRDSEIALVVESRSFAEDLRKRLWAEHMGCSPDELSDNALKDYARWNAIATSNTHWYRALFEMASPFAEPPTSARWEAGQQRLQKHWESRTSESVKKTYEQLNERISGHLHKFPHYFLHDDVKGTSNVKISSATLLSPTSIFSFLGKLEYAAIINVREDLLQ